MIVEFSRRKFLVAAGGTALALPVMEALMPTKQARAAFNDVRRMIFIVTVNGSPRASRPTGEGTGYTMGPILSGLEKHKADMLFVAGLDSKAAVLSNGDPHATGFATTLSGMKCLPGDLFKHGACFMDAACAGTGWGDGPSVDQIIAQQHITAKLPVVHGSLNFAIKNTPGSLYTRMSYTAPGKPLVPEASPADALLSLLYSFRSAGPPSLAPPGTLPSSLAVVLSSMVLSQLAAPLTDYIERRFSERFGQARLLQQRPFQIAMGQFSHRLQHAHLQALLGASASVAITSDVSEQHTLLTSRAERISEPLPLIGAPHLSELFTSTEAELLESAAWSWQRLVPTATRPHGRRLAVNGCTARPR